jgi:hypothetical protein
MPVIVIIRLILLLIGFSIAIAFLVREFAYGRAKKTIHFSTSMPQISTNLTDNLLSNMPRSQFNYSWAMAPMIGAQSGKTVPLSTGSSFICGQILGSVESVPIVTIAGWTLATPRAYVVPEKSNIIVIVRGELGRKLSKIQGVSAVDSTPGGHPYGYQS